MAQEAVGAKRLILFFSPNGTIHNHWRPTGSGDSFLFQPGSILEPLTSLKDDLIVLDGIDFHGVTNHEEGMAAMLTGGGGLNTVSAGKSLDQHVAQQLNAGLKFPSLDLSVQTSAWGASTQTRMLYSEPGKHLPPDDNPLNVYERMFGTLAPGAGEVDKLLIRRQSVLDLVAWELKDLQKKLGAEDKARLEQHLEALQTVEASLQPPSGTCDPPEPMVGLPHLQNDQFPEVLKAQVDLMVVALACGMTRVASLQCSHTVGPPVFSWIGLTDGHHSLSHSGDENLSGVADYVKAERWFSEQFAYLVQKLKDTPEPDGEGTMLENSAILWCQELGDGRMHDCSSVPFVIAGQANGHFQTGQYLDCGGAPHQQLLVSMCHAMGLDNTTFGNPAYGEGPLEVLS